METEEIYLNRLINKRVTGSNYSASTTYALSNSKGNPGEPIFSFDMLIHFEDYYLIIYNPILFFPKETTVEDVLNLKVIDVVKSASYTKYV
jgi:hypothetical protein